MILAMGIKRLSSRTEHLDQSFLVKHLSGARSYKRIAGYFTSSLFEVAGEVLTEVPEIKIVCNIDLHPEDLKVAKLRQSKMLGRWNERVPEFGSLLHRDRYHRLDSFLKKHGQFVRVAPDNVCGFLHGKAGVITLANGEKLGFIGSMNETRSGWRSHYEILWEDDSPEGVAWIEKEFEYLWRIGKPLPDVVIQEVRRRRSRKEVSFEGMGDRLLFAPATLVESPLYREGQQLQPWQQGFLTECMRHYQNHGIVRLLLADEVGLGKTLSLATAALTLCLMEDKQHEKRKPVIIFCPATLTEQWQIELIDKLGIPTARWHTQRKIWLDCDDRKISPAGSDQVERCPLRIGIVSTGLVVQDSDEKQHLLEINFGVVILDEAHRARSRGGVGQTAGTPNKLMNFMLGVAQRSDHVLLGTATPVQTTPHDLWDLMKILHQQKGQFVLGHDFSPWHSPNKVLSILAGQAEVKTLPEAWELVRSPLPAVGSTDNMGARKLYSSIRQDIGIGNAGKPNVDIPISKLTRDTCEIFEEELERNVSGASFFQRENPIVRHTVLRKRQQLEKDNLLDRIGVAVHPDRNLASELSKFDSLFEGKELRTDDNFQGAYEDARLFGKLLLRHGTGSGLMKNLMVQRLCSSTYAAISTAKKLIKGSEEVLEESEVVGGRIEVKTPGERAALGALVSRLNMMQSDPKLKAISFYLDDEKWLERGVVIFSQYYDTASWVAKALAKRYPCEAIGLYAGANRSRLYQSKDSVFVDRNDLKHMVAEYQLRIMVATDAACEGLNLQNLGALINVDLPWNPTRLEQRVGRIKRIGQKYQSVHMLNLVLEKTVEGKIYERLSARMRDRYDLFGSLPDTIKDEWIDDIENLEKYFDQYIEERKCATGFDLRYTNTADPADQDWRECTEVLSRRDFIDLMNQPWS